MPLRAIIDGENYIATLINNDDWNHLQKNVKTKKLPVILPCCNNRGFLRNSKSGIKYFAHDRKLDCISKSDSDNNLKIKNEIIKVCIESGYKITTDIYETDLYTDILATKNNIKIAFNVELKHKNFEEIEKQQFNLKNNNIRGCWLFKKYPKGFIDPSYDFPIFQISVDEKKYEIYLNWDEWDDERKSFQLNEFINLLLSRKIKFCQNVIALKQQKVKIIFFEMNCWKCGRLSHVYYIKNGYYSNCGIELEADNSLWGSEKFCFRPEILKVVNNFLSSDYAKSKNIKVGAIKPRYSRTINEKYNSFGCYYCDALFGDWFIMEDQLEIAYDENNTPAIIEGNVELKYPVSMKYAHWCYSDSGIFCE